MVANSSASKALLSTCRILWTELATLMSVQLSREVLESDLRHDPIIYCVFKSACTTSSGCKWVSVNHFFLRFERGWREGDRKAEGKVTDINSDKEINIDGREKSISFGKCTGLRCFKLNNSNCYHNRQDQAGLLGMYCFVTQ